jgi:uncharacterized membrane protein
MFAVCRLPFIFEGISPDSFSADTIMGRVAHSIIFLPCLILWLISVVVTYTAIVVIFIIAFLIAIPVAFMKCFINYIILGRFGFED